MSKLSRGADGALARKLKKGAFPVVFKITDFAESLREDLQKLERWPSRVRLMQENWIGRSEGMRILFDIAGREDKLEIFTTRPDTLFGASFCAISADHPISIQLASHSSEMQSFIEECHRMGTSEAVLEQVEKQGFDTGLKVHHPLIQGRTLPLYVANFVHDGIWHRSDFWLPST